jgi:thiol-disulfide isomerase/thioredoxin
MNAMIRRRVTFGLALSVLALSPNVVFADDSEDLKKIQSDLTELKKDVASLKEQMQGLSRSIAQAVSAMKAGGGAPAPQPQRPAMTMVGQTAPVEKVTRLDGSPGIIGGKRDKPQVLFAYASWCGFCKKSLPWMETLHQKYKDKGVEVLALNLDARGEGGRSKTEQQSREHFESMKVTMPMVMTGGTTDTAKIGAALKAQSFPTLYVLGTNGEVESVHVGAKPGLDEIVGKELDLLMEGKTRAAFPK